MTIFSEKESPKKSGDIAGGDCRTASGYPSIHLFRPAVRNSNDGDEAGIVDHRSDNRGIFYKLSLGWYANACYLGNRHIIVGLRSY